MSNDEQPEHADNSGLLRGVWSALLIEAIIAGGLLAGFLVRWW